MMLDVRVSVLSKPAQVGEPRLAGLPATSAAVGVPTAMVRHDGFFRWGPAEGKQQQSERAG